MRKLAKIMGTCMLLAALAWFGTVLADRQSLNENVIRLHVVAASDSEEDQQIKLQVRDALIETLQPGMDGLADADAAKEYGMAGNYMAGANIAGFLKVANSMLAYGVV